MDLLVARRQYQLANRAFRLAIKCYPRNRRWRRFLVVHYSRSGASALASKLMQGWTDPLPVPLSLLSLHRAVRFRGRVPHKSHTLRLPTILSKLGKDAPHATASTLNLLLRAQRHRAAKQLFFKAHHLPASARTAIGNDILNASMRHRSRRNSRRVQKVLQVWQELVDNGNFVPDRVSVNILLKALLSWTTEVNHTAVRSLFDHIVGMGYPTGGVVPEGSTVFRTKGTTLMTLPKLSTPISFSNHVQPLYKMFVRAFYQRHDYDGARRIVGILKALQAVETDKRWNRIKMRLHNK